MGTTLASRIIKSANKLLADHRPCHVLVGRNCTPLRIIDEGRRLETVTMPWCWQAYAALSGVVAYQVGGSYMAVLKARDEEAIRAYLRFFRRMHKSMGERDDWPAAFSDEVQAAGEDGPGPREWCVVAGMARVDACWVTDPRGEFHPGIPCAADHIAGLMRSGAP